MATTTQAADDQATVAAGAEDGEVATMATTTLHRHIHPRHLALPSPQHGRRLAHPPGVLASSAERRPARPQATLWEVATTAALPLVKLDRQIGLEMEAARSLGLRGRRLEVEGRRDPHHLAGRDMNRRALVGVVGGRLRLGFK